MEPFNDVIGCGCLAMANTAPQDLENLPSIRIGKDVRVSWPVLTNGEAQSLSGRKLLLVLVGPGTERYEMPFQTEGNVVKFTFFGKDQKKAGLYTVVLIENYGEEGQSVVDQDAFVLVPRTSMENVTGR